MQNFASYFDDDGVKEDPEGGGGSIDKFLELPFKKAYVSGRKIFNNQEYNATTQRDSWRSNSEKNVIKYGKLWLEGSNGADTAVEGERVGRGGGGGVARGKRFGASEPVRKTYNRVSKGMRGWRGDNGIKKGRERERDGGGGRGDNGRGGKSRGARARRDVDDDV